MMRFAKLLSIVAVVMMISFVAAGAALAVAHRVEQQFAGVGEAFEFVAVRFSNGEAELPRSSVLCDFQQNSIPALLQSTGFPGIFQPEETTFGPMIVEIARTKSWASSNSR